MTDGRRRVRTDGVTLRQRVRYRFDILLARGTGATLVWLGILTLVVVAISAVALALFGVALSGSQGDSYFESFWQSLMRTLDPGTMADDVGWGRRILALLVTVFGLLVAGTLIGVIAAGVESRLERMRRGRSLVIESGHAVILGASERLPLLVRQLALARIGGQNSVVVVLADGDPAELGEAVRAVVPESLGMRLVFRAGDPTRLADLELVRLQEAALVIVLVDDEGGDAAAMRAVIAAKSDLGENHDIPIVVELNSPSSSEILTRVYPQGVHPMVTANAQALIASFALREPGLGQVALSLFDDRGSDIHVVDAPILVGKRYGEAVTAFPGARPIGRVRPDGSSQLNPGGDVVFEEGDRLVVLSEDPVLTFSGLTGGPTTSEEVELDLALPAQRVAVLGWSELGAKMLGDWSRAANPGSSVEVLIDPDVGSADRVGVLASDSRFRITETADLDEVRRRVPEVDVVVLLSHAEELGPDIADTRTLLFATALSKLIDATDDGPRLIVELSNPENLPLVPTGPDDFVVSDAIGSQLIAQLAEQPERRPVILDMYDPSTASMHLVPAASLGLAGVTTPAEIYAAGRSAGVTAIGWRLSRERGGDLAMNPPADSTVDLQGSDRIVIVG